jgi:hypothetical protein
MIYRRLEQFIFYQGKWISKNSMDFKKLIKISQNQGF